MTQFFERAAASKRWLRVVIFSAWRSLLQARWLLSSQLLLSVGALWRSLARSNPGVVAKILQNSNHQIFDRPDFGDGVRNGNDGICRLVAKTVRVQTVFPIQFMEIRVQTCL